jgi:hypothetical protein
MKKHWSRPLGLAVLALAIVGGILALHGPKARQLAPEFASVAPVKVQTAPASKPEIIRRAQMTNWDDFTNRFETRMKPAIAKWCKVYQGRIPFGPDDVTLDKFHSKVGGFIYTFMLGDTTFSVYDGPQGTHVFYMMTKQASQELNNPGNGATQHDISTPATRQEIIGLLTADSGIDYPAEQVSINPTGKFSSMQGGVMVEAGGIVGSGAYRIMTFTNLDFVLDGNGQIVSYQR